MAHSWIIYDLVTGKSVMETWNAGIAAKVNRNRYGVVTALEWLSTFNAACAIGRGFREALTA